VNPDIFTVIFGGCHLAAILFSLVLRGSTAIEGAKCPILSLAHAAAGGLLGPACSVWQPELITAWYLVRLLVRFLRRNGANISA
jgi:hypothetical protein